MLALLVISVLLEAANCNPTRWPHKAPISLLYEYPKAPGWLENIAVRSNGELLVTSIGVPGSISVINPFTKDPTPKLITGFEFTDTLGIVETEPDVFHVLASNFSQQTVTVQSGTNAVWRLDFNSNTTRPTPQKVVTLDDAVFLNGLTAFNSSILFAADSALGVVWAVDLEDKKYWVAANDTLMKPVPGQGFLEGINGLHFRSAKHGHKELSFTNSQQSIFGCIDFDQNARAIGPARLVARPVPEKGLSEINWDDFAFNRAGTAFLATEIGNSVQAITADGRAFVVAGDLNSTLIASPTATAFGRTRKDANTLYVTTAGGLFFPVIINGTKNTVGAQIVAVDLSGHV